MVDGPVLEQETRQRRAVGRLGQCPQAFADRCLGRSERVNVNERLQKTDEPLFKRRPKRQEAQIPLPTFVDAGEAPVQQLVAEVEAQLRVLICAEVVATSAPRRGRGNPSPVRKLPPQRPDEPFRKRPARGRETWRVRQL